MFSPCESTAAILSQTRHDRRKGVEKEAGTADAAPSARCFVRCCKRQHLAERLAGRCWEKNGCQWLFALQSMDFRCSSYWSYSLPEDSKTREDLHPQFSIPHSLRGVQVQRPYS